MLQATSHAGKLIMTVFAGIAEFERDLIRERTSAGRQAARRRGFGRPRKLNPEQTNLVRRLINEGKIRQRDRRHLQRPHRNHLSALSDGGLINYAAATWSQPCVMLRVAHRDEPRRLIVRHAAQWNERSAVTPTTGSRKASTRSKRRHNFTGQKPSQPEWGNMRCSKCGSDNREGRKFCTTCGTARSHPAGRKLLR